MKDFWNYVLSNMDVCMVNSRRARAAISSRASHLIPTCAFVLFSYVDSPKSVVLLVECCIIWGCSLIACNGDDKLSAVKVLFLLRHWLGKWSDQQASCCLRLRIEPDLTQCISIPTQYISIPAQCWQRCW